MMYFTSDHHFMHTNVIKYCNRPFISCQEMDEEMIKRWNERITKTDIVYHLGDFFLCSKEKAIEILNRLNGKIYFLEGSHDKVTMSILKNNLCTNITHLGNLVEICIQDKTFDQGKKHITLCHYAMKRWPKSHYNAWHLFGHSHGNLKNPEKGSMDVGVDTNNFYPYSWDEIKAKLKSEESEKCL